MMAINFPASPTEGQVFNPGTHIKPMPNYIYRSGVWIKKAGTATPRNLLINPFFQISQQNGRAACAIAGTTTAYYVADQWAVSWSIASTKTTVGAYSFAPALQSNPMKYMVGGSEIGLSALA
jgi:hypothetical protein